MKIRGFAAYKAKTALKEFSYEPALFGADDIEIAITHCGICHSDIHLVDDDWGVSKFPFVPGHEIVGNVSGLGKGVKNLKMGQRVGVGWQRGSCLNCEWCLTGQENLCSENQATCVGHNGGFADRIIIDSRFAFPIPDGLASEDAAPLLCGGITVYSPLARLGVKPVMKVGVIGIGGLGHMAIQFARAMGCEVTAFSANPEKKKDAESFGASRFVVTKKPADMKAAEGSVDFLMSVASADINWPEYLKILRPNGKLIVLGASPSDMTLSPMGLIVGQKAVVGSNIGGRALIQDMLTMAARHGIKAKTEVMPLSEVNAALEKVRRNQARYRMVLKCG